MSQFAVLYSDDPLERTIHAVRHMGHMARTKIVRNSGSEKAMPDNHFANVTKRDLQYSMKKSVEFAIFLDNLPPAILNVIHRVCTVLFDT